MSDALDKYVSRVYTGHKSLPHKGDGTKAQTHKNMIAAARAKREATQAQDGKASKSKLPMPDYGGLDAILDQIRDIEGDVPDDAA